MKTSRTAIAMGFIFIVVTTSVQCLLSIGHTELLVTSNQAFTFSTSYMYITDGNNKLIVDATSVRGQILSVIEQNPGIYFREICLITDRENGLVQYHLQVLVDFKNVSKYQDGRYVRYFAGNSSLYDELGKIAMSAWNRPIDRSILAKLYDAGKKRHTIKELAAALGVSRQAISAHVNRLKRLGLTTLLLGDDSVAKTVSLTKAAIVKLEILNSCGIIALPIKT